MVSGNASPVPCALRFAYDGRRFDGFPRQPQARLRTVEGALLEALWDAGAVRDPEDCGYRPGSRTDQGVSARENVVAFGSMIPPERVPGALVGRVPGLWPLAGVKVEPWFDPRRARWREYRYFLSARELPSGVRGRELDEVLQVFVGRHDFSAFARKLRHEPHRSPMREVLSMEVEGPSGSGLYVVRVRGASFLWQQVRRMLGAALAVVRDEIGLGEVRRALQAPSGPVPWGLVPATRLVLWRVHDPRLEFETPWTLREQLQREWVSDWGEAVATSRLLEGLFMKEPAPTVTTEDTG